MRPLVVLENMSKKLLSVHHRETRDSNMGGMLRDTENGKKRFTISLIRMSKKVNKWGKIPSKIMKTIFLELMKNMNPLIQEAHIPGRIN